MRSHCAGRADIAESDWDFFYRCYRRTYLSTATPYSTTDPPPHVADHAAALAAVRRRARH
jgi:predicted N-acyltransferase